MNQTENTRKPMNGLSMQVKQAGPPCCGPPPSPSKAHSCPELMKCAIPATRVRHCTLEACCSFAGPENQIRPTNNLKLKLATASKAQNKNLMDEPGFRMVPPPSPAFPVSCWGGHEGCGGHARGHKGAVGVEGVKGEACSINGGSVSDNNKPQQTLKEKKKSSHAHPTVCM